MQLEDFAETTYKKFAELADAVSEIRREHGEDLKRYVKFVETVIDVRNEVKNLRGEMNTRFDRVDERIDGLTDRLTRIEDFLQMEKTRH